jgi:protein-tyrosine phosphatase
VLDLHNHVLFGLDDGCRTLDESRALSEAARAAGHVGFVATPHIRPGMFDNDPAQIHARRAEVQGVVEAAGLELYLGAEYYFCPELLEAARAKALLTLGETSRFVLVELPTQRLPVRYDEILYEIRLAGYLPVIAHPERCQGLQEDLPKVLAALAQVGVLLQLDLGSLTGHYGRGAQSAAEALVAEGAYHVAACDLHRPEDVPAIVGPALARLARLLHRRRGGWLRLGAPGPEAQAGVRTLTLDNPRRLVADAPLSALANV